MQNDTLTHCDSPKAFSCISPQRGVEITTRVTDYRHQPLHIHKSQLKLIGSLGGGEDGVCEVGVFIGLHFAFIETSPRSHLDEKLTRTQ